MPEIFSRLSPDRPLAFAIVGVLVVVNGFSGIILGSLHSIGLLDSLMALAGVSAVVWFAMVATLAIAHEPGEARWARGDLPALAILLAMAFLPAPWIGGVASFCAGLYLQGTSEPGSRERRVAVILLALSGPLLWGRLILTAFGPLLLAIDGGLVGAITGTAATGNVVAFAGESTTFYIGGPCSSVHNISLAVLMWGTVAALLKLRIDARLIAYCAAAMLAMFLLNIVRLVLIALFHADFAMLHAGTGATVFGWIGLLLSGAVVGLGAYDAARRQL